MNRFSVMGIPSSNEIRQAMGVFEYTPPTGAVERRCIHCNEWCWVGPQHQTLMVKWPDTKVACARCAKSIHHLSLLCHLGGEGGSYKLASDN